MRILTFTFIILLVSPITHAGDKTNIFLGQALDLGSTEWVISKGAIEGNPLLKDRSVRISYKIVASGIAYFGCKELRKRGHNGTAKWISRGVLFVGAGMAVNAIIQNRRMGK